ncbi:hypothetical protein ACC712_38660, partial [Rhizobium ruizarguesonis]
LPEKRAGSLRQLLARIEHSVPAGLPPLLAATRTHIVLADGWEVDVHILKQKGPLAPEDGALRRRFDAFEQFAVQQAA